MTTTIESTTRRHSWFRRRRWESSYDSTQQLHLTKLVPGPWHLVRSVMHGVDYAPCNTTSYSRHTTTLYGDTPVGELPEGKVCPKCKRAAKEDQA